MRTLIAAAVLALASTAASAAPVTTHQVPTIGEPQMTLAQYDRRPTDRRWRDGRPHRHRYVPGRRYDAPPPRWRRYHMRPRDWRRRGCIIVGPLWFCP
ncbi:MAG: hypothetical protein KDJ41_17540 [Hyphomicrobiaceae bacterium]|nr:hypothetical protein [Hyphomicrobiaceae bacterium]